MSVSWHGQRQPITWEQYLHLDEDIRRDLEIVDGFVVPRELRGREHQKVGTRLSLAMERAAVAEMRTGDGSSYETNTEVDVLLWEVPPMARKPDAVLHRCLPEYEQLAAEHCVIVAEVLSTWSVRRDRVHKMSDYADAGVPHYWLISFDKVGALTIERYALSGRKGRYTHIGTTHRDMGPVAVSLTDPFPLEILWQDLEVAPPVN
ncbi:Uma2 family endonuclease [Nocardia sp. CA-135953]|uniref:Uma2 family endonuclease n=1 Tax=Nocardia sp. CA-135953 TaxID=3239978 RepID=UPI003D96641D